MAPGKSAQKRQYKLSDGTDLEEYRDKTIWSFGNKGLRHEDVILIASLVPKVNVLALYLGGNKIVDISPLRDSIPNVQTLSLHHNQIVDISPLRNSMPNMQELSLHHNQIVDINPILDHLGNLSMPNVQDLLLHWNKIDETTKDKFIAYWELLDSEDDALTM